MLSIISCIVTFPLYPDSIQFQHLSTENGLSNNYIHCFYEDHNGYLWIGTSLGLNRYDGNSVTNIQVNDRNDDVATINQIYDIAQDEENNIWCSSFGEIFCYSYRTSKITRYDIHELTALDNLHIYAIDCQNNLIYLGTNKGIYVLDLNIMKTYKLFMESDHIGEVRSILINDDGYIWFSGSENIYKYHLVSGTYSTYQTARSTKYKQDETAVKIQKDTYGQIWFGAPSGIYKYQAGTDTIVFCYPLEGNINFQVEYPYIWIASWTNGLIRYNMDTGKSDYFNCTGKTENELSCNTLTSIYIDHKRTIWIGTGDKGIDIIQQQPQILHDYTPTNANGMSSAQIRDVYMDSNKNIWIGTYLGLNKYDAETETFTPIYSSGNINNKNPIKDIVITICEDNNGKLWVGTLGGLQILDKTNNCLEQFSMLTKDDILRNNQIWSLYKDTNGWLWIGTRSGIFHLDPQTNNYHTYFFGPDITPSTPNENSGTCFLEDNGNIWIGTKNGVVRINADKTISMFTNSQHSLSSYSINTIFKDKKGNIWFCTNKGLAKFVSDEKGFELRLASNNFNNADFVQMQQDIDGLLWIVTSKQLLIYNPELPCSETSCATYMYQLKDHTNMPCGFIITDEQKAYLGTPGGLLYMDIKGLKNNCDESIMHLSRFLLFNTEQVPLMPESPLTENIDYTHHINLTYHQNSFSFEYIALNLSHIYPFQYSYQLEGYDRNWIYAGNNTTAVYTQIPPGKYKFKVCLSNTLLSEKPVIKEITIRIHPPVYATWWAFTGYGIVFILLLYAFRRYSIIDIKEKNELQINLLKKENAEALYNMKVKFFMNTSHEFRTPLTLINGPLQRLLKEEHESEKLKMLLLIQKNTNKLLELVNQLLEFRKTETGTRKLKVKENDIIYHTSEIIASFEELAERQAIQLEMKTTFEHLNVWFDSDMYERILFNLLSNSFKHTPTGGRISIYITLTEKDAETTGKTFDLFAKSEKRQKSFVKIVVEDTGAGIPQKDIGHIFDRFYQIQDNSPGTGIGLSLAKNLVELHHGYIEVESEENVITRFAVLLPMGKEHFEPKDLETSQNTDCTDTYTVHLTPVNYNNSTANVYDDLDKNNLMQNMHKESDKPIVLIVEDNPDIIIWLRATLQEQYVIYAANNGKTGLQKTLKIMPDIILCDINMPVMNGIQLTQELKKNQLTAHIPIIMLTALNSNEYMVEGLNYGADDYITKPFDINVLNLKIRNLLLTLRHSNQKNASEMIFNEFAPKNIESNDEFMEKLDKFLKTNMANSDMDVDEIVQQLAISRSNLYRKIKTMTGMSIKRYVLTYRMSCAQKLLQNPDIRISEVMNSVGICNRAYFIKTFKDLYGITPSDYQERFMKGDIKI